MTHLQQTKWLKRNKNTEVKAPAVATHGKSMEADKNFSKTVSCIVMQS